MDVRSGAGAPATGPRGVQVGACVASVCMNGLCIRRGRYLISLQRTLPYWGPNGKSLPIMRPFPTHHLQDQPAAGEAAARQPVGWRRNACDGTNRHVRRDVRVLGGAGGRGTTPRPVDSSLFLSTPIATPATGITRNPRSHCIPGIRRPTVPAVHPTLPVLNLRAPPTIYNKDE